VVNVVMAGTGTSDEYVECASRPGLQPKGKLFRKQILHWGDFAHPNLPGKKITVDDKFAETLVENFNNGVCDIVQVPLVDGKNHHTEDPTRNVGQVIGLEKDAKGIYALVDARKSDAAAELGKTLIGASAMMNLDYTDTRTGKKVGPTLLHMAVTNRPYITGLDAFDEVLSLSADTPDEATVLLGAGDDEENEMPMTRDEMIAALKADHGIDVEALLETSDETAELAALSNALGDEELSLSDVAEAVLELSQKNDEQANLISALVEERNSLRLSAAETEVDSLVKAGRILPKQRDRMLRLSMEDREAFDDLLPEQSVVSLSEDGVTTHEDTHANSAEAEIARIVALANANSGK
jgi:hypothetical protein